MNLKQAVENLAKEAGLTINGEQAWDPQIHNDKLYSRALHQQSMGLGDSYVDGWWDCDKLDEMFSRIIRAQLPKKAFKTQGIWRLLLAKINLFQAALINYQTKKRALEVGEKHYDVGNKLYQKMLDKRMVYTCGYWKNANNLDDAQRDKLDLVCRKINLRQGQRVLDIGCGWGSFAKFAAENYGAEVVGITISKEQLALGKEMCAGLPIELRFQDYRDVNEQFDHVVSLGMFEHVGPKNYREYMQVAARCLKDEGLFLLHTIGNSESLVKSDPWIMKHIFPNGLVPSLAQITKAVENIFVVEGVHNFSADYDKTLMAWYDNFSTYWGEPKEEYDERFFRMWRYYLLCCAGAFRSRDMQLWQIVLSKQGVVGGYKPVR